jgi:hypothetical protein
MVHALRIFAHMRNESGDLHAAERKVLVLRHEVAGFRRQIHRPRSLGGTTGTARLGATADASCCWH